MPPKQTTISPTSTTPLSSEISITMPVTTSLQSTESRTTETVTTKSTSGAKAATELVLQMSKTITSDQQATTTSNTPTSTEAVTSSTSTPPVALPTSGTPVEGSSFPERIRNKPEFNKEEKVLGVLSELPSDVKQQLSQTIGDFIKDCQYDGHSCFLS